jgi:hypothetical protein
LAVKASVAAPHEQQAEGGEDGFAFELVARARATNQRRHQQAIDEPVGAEGHGHRQDHSQDRIDAEEREHPERGERSAHQKLAVGEVHDARHAVLQVEADGDEGVEPAQDHAAQDDFDRRHVREGR